MTYQRHANPEADPADEYGWYEADPFPEGGGGGGGGGGAGESGAGAGEGAAVDEDNDVDWGAIVTGGVSIIDKIIGAATGQAPTPTTPTTPTVDPYAGQKKGVPAWVWVAGGGAILFFLVSRRR